MGGIHDFVMKADPISREVHGAGAKALGVKEEVKGDILGLSNEAQEKKLAKQQKALDEASNKTKLTIPIGTPRKAGT